MLVNEGSKNTLYSGLFGDYDLGYENYNKLEKIHLIKPNRYKTIGEYTIKRFIPGDVFTIMGENIININTTYIFQSDEVINFKFRRIKMFLLIIAQMLFVFAFVLFSILLLFSIEITKSTFLNKIILMPLWVRFIFIFTLNLNIGLILPFTLKNKEKKVAFIGRKNYTPIIISNVVFVLLSFLLWYYFK